MKRKKEIDMIDELGEKYCAAGTTIKEASEQQEAVKTEIQKLVGFDPENPKECIKIGNKYSVGYTLRNPAPAFDESLMQKLYPKEYARCCRQVTTTIFCANTFEKRMLKKKALYAKIAKKCTVQAKAKGAVKVTLL